MRIHWVVAPWLNWIEQPPPKGQVSGSNPLGVTIPAFEDVFRPESPKAFGLILPDFGFFLRIFLKVAETVFDCA